MNQNLKNYIRLFSNEIDIVIDDEKKDKNYEGKKQLLLKCVYRILSILESRKKFIPKYESFMSAYKNQLCKISLGLSLKQLDSKIMTNKKCVHNLENAHKANIIDNITLLTPMNLLSSDVDYNKITESIAYSNAIESSNHRSELLMAMFEKYDKKKIPVAVKKQFKSYMQAYNIVRDNIIKSYM